MATVEKYQHYTAIQLATDGRFIAWVKFRDEASDLFWKEYLKKYPSQTSVVDKAKAIVNQMRIVQETMEGGQAEAVWDKIDHRVRQMPANKKTSPVAFMGKWWAAAAILLVLATAIYYLSKNDLPSKTAETTDKQQIFPNDVGPGGDKAILTLADGTKLALDSANNGMITRQGNVTIIKLDGKLSYKGSAANQGAPQQLTYNTITTPKGGQYQLELADGSRVWLNAASSLRFPTFFAGGERKVELQGEGYFEIAHNDAMPFIVEKEETKVRVLGTRFNINAYDDEEDIKVTLLQGSVSVSMGNSDLLLKPGQQAQIATTIKLVDDVNIEKVMAWKNGWFEFDETDLPTIMRQIGRWYDVEIVYEGKSTTHTFGGRISKNLPMSSILQMLKSNGVKDFRLEGKKLIVQP